MKLFILKELFFDFGLDYESIRIFYRIPNTFDDRGLQEILIEYNTVAYESLIPLNSIMCLDIFD